MKRTNPLPIVLGGLLAIGWILYFTFRQQAGEAIAPQTHSLVLVQQACAESASTRNNLSQGGAVQFNGGGVIMISPHAYSQLKEETRRGLRVVAAMDVACPDGERAGNVSVTVRSSLDNHKIGEGTIDSFTEY